MEAAVAVAMTIAMMTVRAARAAVLERVEAAAVPERAEKEVE